MPHIARTTIALLLLVVLLPSVARAQPRIALIVTNQAYTQASARLTHTHRDGELVKAALEEVGFQVWVAKDTSNERALLQAVAEHVRRLAEAGPAAVGFFYYSGHGAADRPNGENFLIPTDVPLTHASQLALLAVQLEKITSSLAGVGSMSFVVFDACRNVSLLRDTKDLAFKGFAPVREQTGLLVAFATEPGNVAVDQSLYARALAEEVVKPGLEAGQVFRRVRLRVRSDTRETQSPEYLDKRNHDFHFAAAMPAPGAITSPQTGKEGTKRAAPTDPCTPIVGTWLWYNGVSVTVDASNTTTQSDGRSATVHCWDGVYSFTWLGFATARMRLSSDGNRLSGNSLIGRISAVRQ